MTGSLNRTSLNFNMNIRSSELKRVKSVKEIYGLAVGGYIRIIIDDLLTKIGDELENFEEFFPDKSGRQGYSFGEIDVGEKNVNLINRIKEKKGTSRKALLRKAFDIALDSEDRSPETINKLFKIEGRAKRKPKK